VGVLDFFLKPDSATSKNGNGSGNKQGRFSAIERRLEDHGKRLRAMEQAKARDEGHQEGKEETEGAWRKKWNTLSANAGGDAGG